MNSTDLIVPNAWIEAAAESFLVTDTDLDFPGPTIIYVNPAFEQMTGWLSKDVLGQSPRILQGPKTDKSVFGDLRAKLLRGEIWTGQAINYRKNGDEFIMEWSIAPVPDHSGSICQYLAVQRDVTKRVETERQLQESRDELMASLLQREQMRETFGKFVPNAIVDNILDDAGQLEPDIREATIFYSDIQKFSNITETMNPKNVLDLVNEYFKAVTGIIEEKGGVIFQFQGDAILATFNLPIKEEQHAVHAVEAAIDVLKKLNSHLFSCGTNLKTRIGINTGRVIAGTVGGSSRLGYTVHGDAVNLAAHIEQVNKIYGTQVLITESTVSQLGNRFDLRIVDTIAVKGRSNSVTLYSVNRPF
ncbi:adenylate/guanylate cyclase domain-containing protein [Pseudomonadota bacterium]